MAPTISVQYNRGTMKPCSVCSKEFAPKRKYDYWCTPCTRAHGRARYAARLEHHRARRNRNTAAKYARMRALLDAAKAVPCADCGKRYPPCVMDFDHMAPAQKGGNLANMVAIQISESRLIEEMNKCEVVCSNCHRIRTHQTRRANPNRASVQRKLQPEE